MKSFVLNVRDATHSERIEGVQSFVGEDASGGFGIYAQHDRMMTALLFGLCRYRTGENPWQYLAMPGGILYFANNVLTISTRRYYSDDNFERISTTLTEKLLEEERALHEVKKGLQNMERELLKRMRDLAKEQAWLT